MIIGALPRTPRFIALVSRRQFLLPMGGLCLLQTLKRQFASAHCLPQPWHGAQVAPQRCPILRAGKAEL